MILMKTSDFMFKWQGKHEDGRGLYFRGGLGLSRVKTKNKERCKLLFFV